MPELHVCLSCRWAVNVAGKVGAAAARTLGDGRGELGLCGPGGGEKSGWCSSQLLGSWTALSYLIIIRSTVFKIGTSGSHMLVVCFLKFVFHFVFACFYF